MQNKKRFSGRISTKKIATLAILSALGVALAMLVRFPLIPSAPFLEYDAADIPIFLGTFMYGPIAGLIMTVVVSVIQGVTVSAHSGYIGIIMHIFATGSYVLVAGLIYKFKRTFKGALLSVSIASLVMIVVMVFWNIIFTPIFMGVDRDAVYAMLLPAIIPFNAIKAGINSIFTLILYKRVSKFFKWLTKENETNGKLRNNK
ncbi:MAG: ECF transporter S component [Clostridia bacterium]